MCSAVGTQQLGSDAETRAYVQARVRAQRLGHAMPPPAPVDDRVDAAARLATPSLTTGCATRPAIDLASPFGAQSPVVTSSPLASPLQSIT